MERLTEYTGEGQAIPRMDLKNNGHQKCMERLAEYEDLEEQCAKENSWCLRMLLHKWKEFIEDIQELYKYRKAEEQGKLLKLPCAVGDTVYIVKGGEVLRNYVVQIHISQMEAQTFFSCYDDCFCIEQIGKTVFLTMEEAEAALKEL